MTKVRQDWVNARWNQAYAFFTHSKTRGSVYKNMICVFDGEVFQISDLVIDQQERIIYLGTKDSRTILFDANGDYDEGAFTTVAAFKREMRALFKLYRPVPV